MQLRTIHDEVYDDQRPPDTDDLMSFVFCRTPFFVTLRVFSRFYFRTGIETDALLQFSSVFVIYSLETFVRDFLEMHFDFPRLCYYCEAVRYMCA